ncbi:MAG: hypothetical protein WAU75_01545 [Solirubrobacteraceae bacterium]
MAEGTPLPLGSWFFGVAGFAPGFFFFFLLAFFLLAFFWPPREDGCSPRLEPVGTGVVLEVLEVVLEPLPLPLCAGGAEVEVEVEVEVELEAELELELDDVDEGVAVVELVGEDVVVVVVVLLVDTETAGVGALDGAHCLLSDWTGPVIGSPIAEMGVPGGTLTLKTRVWPSTRVTVTVHASADAVGMAARAMAMKIAPAMASTANSFRRPITAAPLRPSRCAHSNEITAKTYVDCRGRY